MTKSADIAGLEAASRALGGQVLGPRELATVLGFDPLAALTTDERRTVARLPFSAADLERARVEHDILVLRIPRGPQGPLTILALAAHLGGGLDPKVHIGSGYMLRPEWTIDEQPFAVAETCAAGWWLVRREPLPTTLNRTYGDQDAALGELGGEGLRVVGYSRAVRFGTLGVCPQR